jgi:hypothetical protein
MLTYSCNPTIGAKIMSADDHIELGCTIAAILTVAGMKEGSDVAAVLNRYHRILGFLRSDDNLIQAIKKKD